MNTTIEGRTAECEMDTRCSDLKASIGRHAVGKWSVTKDLGTTVSTSTARYYEAGLKCLRAWCSCELLSGLQPRLGCARWRSDASNEAAAKVLARGAHVRTQAPALPATAMQGSPHHRNSIPVGSKQACQPIIAN